MSRKKILVVDDNPVILKTLSFTLTAGGYDVFTAEGGAEAVSVVRGDKPDLIILDISFPPDVAHGGGVPWDGFLIMDWMRRMVDNARKIPIIIITIGEAEKYEKKSLAAGAAAFFQKPIDNDALMTTVRKLLGDTGTPES